MWLNGPFGVGKTQTAHELQRRWPGSFVCDPEHLRFALHRMTPRELRGDFQDEPLWREGTRRTLARLLQRRSGAVIVPMTVVVPQYLDEMVGELAREGFDVRHFTLMASSRAVRRRLLNRGEGGASYGARQLERCLRELEQPLFAQHVHTEGRSVEQVAEEVARQVGITLEPRTTSRLNSIIRRWQVQWAHRRQD
nr:AAA family ATPase [Deinococcus metallilatus]